MRLGQPPSPVLVAKHTQAGVRATAGRAEAFQKHQQLTVAMGERLLLGLLPDSLHVQQAAGDDPDLTLEACRCSQRVANTPTAWVSELNGGRSTVHASLPREIA